MSTSATTEIDDSLSLAAACRMPELRRDGRGPHFSSLFRWINRGIIVNGQRVRLRAWRVGGRLATSRRAVMEFLEALDPNRQSPVTHAMRDRELDRLEQQLEGAGL